MPLLFSIYHLLRDNEKSCKATIFVLSSFKHVRSKYYLIKGGVYRQGAIMRYYTVREVADLLKVKEKTVREWLSARKLTHFKISGKCVRISDQQLEAFLKKREIKVEVI
mgnify:CR=1 FL=1